MEDLASDPIIPGLATGTSARPDLDVGQGPSANFSSKEYEIGGEGDDWDSDSDDDLQIVLNDNNHGPMGMEVDGLMMANNDDDEDKEPQVIMADNDTGHQPPEEQDWGEDQGQAIEGKAIVDAAKANGGLITAPKTGYSNYGYHPFHSQFKYVRPGATPLPGGTPLGTGGVHGQVRPPVNVGNNMVGRGRVDWRVPGMKGSPMQKGFHPGFWGGNAQGRGLEFTLPSHKTVFDVDMESFEEKPWKYPGVDVSDFFNFGLDEDRWKEYCKQLEQLRLESTMQSKIRVYESSRAEQEYDPDLPPELAAAAGIHDTSAEITDIFKLHGEVGDTVKGLTRVRPPLPTGRAIQVETGCGERLPSVDSRPPRIRDSDAVIEIVLQDSLNEGYAGNDAIEYPVDGSPGEAVKVEIVEDSPHDRDEYFDRHDREYRCKDDDGAGNRSPILNSSQDDMHDEECNKSMPLRASSDHLGGSGDQVPAKDAGSPNEERKTKGEIIEQCPHISSGDSALDRRSHDYIQEDSTDSTEGKKSVESFDPTEGKIPSQRQHVPEIDVPTGRKSAKSTEFINVSTSDNTPKDFHRLHSPKYQKLGCRVEPVGIKNDDAGDFKGPRSSNNSKAMGSSKDPLKLHESDEEKIVEDSRSTYMGAHKGNRSEGGRDSRRKDHEGRVKVERNYLLTKGRETYYSHRDLDPYAADHFHLRGEGTDWRKERDYSEAKWQRRDEEPHGRRIRTEDARKQERTDLILSRDKVKAREIDRSDKDEYLHTRTLLDNGKRAYIEKDAGLRYRDKDESSKSRHEVLDDHYMKRRKDDEHVRRDRVEKDEILLGRGESNSARRKRDRDDISNQWKKDDQLRIRDNMDDHSSARLKDDVWMQREKVELQRERERDEWYRTKQSYEGNLPRREREDGRLSNRSNRNVEEKRWAGHSHGREEYEDHDKDTGRYSEHPNKRDLVEDETGTQYQGNENIHARGKQSTNDMKRSRQEKSSARNDYAVHAPLNQREHEKHRDIVKSARESPGHGYPGSSRRHRVEKGVINEMADMKGTSEKAEAMLDNSVKNIARERREVSSDDEQNCSKRGRSKLERWTSRKERDYNINSKSSSTAKIKVVSRDVAAGSISESSTGAEDESYKKVDTVDGNQLSVGAKDGAVSDGKDADAKRMDDGHLETFEKLKRRSERFKVPLTSEKDVMTIKKTESEASSSPQNDVVPNSFVKPERPARKRRWISS